MRRRLPWPPPHADDLLHPPLASLSRLDDLPSPHAFTAGPCHALLLYDGPHHPAAARIADLALRHARRASGGSRALLFLGEARAAHAALAAALGALAASAWLRAPRLHRTLRRCAALLAPLRLGAHAWSVGLGGGAATRLALLPPAHPAAPLVAAARAAPRALRRALRRGALVGAEAAGLLRLMEGGAALLAREPSGAAEALRVRREAFGAREAWAALGEALCAAAVAWLVDHVNARLELAAAGAAEAEAEAELLLLVAHGAAADEWVARMHCRAPPPPPRGEAAAVSLELLRQSEDGFLASLADGRLRGGEGELRRRVADADASFVVCASTAPPAAKKEWVAELRRLDFMRLLDRLRSGFPCEPAALAPPPPRLTLHLYTYTASPSPSP
ncbi:hypothetical protein AB1Y20_018459 [Prymnesium parvum]|uniref:Uncharacterized protein n=1 Tax=Prymnesium parvum TaxID=97485 RepID=A0AB34JRP3_PRYPA